MAAGELSTKWGGTHPVGWKRGAWSLPWEGLEGAQNHRSLESAGGNDFFVHRLTSVLGLRKAICEGHLGGGVHAVLGKLLPSNCQGIFRRRNLVFMCSYTALPKKVSHLLWNSLPPWNSQDRRRGIYKSVQIGFSGDGLGHGTIYIFIHTWSSPPRQNGLQKLKEKQSWIAWCSGSAGLTSRWRHSGPPSPSRIWQVRLFSPQLGRRQNGNLSVTEWKYQKYIGYWELHRTKRKSRRRSEKVSKMGGSESKATVLECMIKHLKKGFGGDYGVKMKPNHLHILWGRMAHCGSRMATREHHELKKSGSSLYSSLRRARTPGSISICWLMARISSRRSYLDKALYPEGKGKNINGTKIDWW